VDVRSARVAAVIAATLLALPSVAACTGGDAPEAGPTPTAEPTPLADFATDEVTVAREAFCARVAPAAVEDALGGAAERADEWVNGDRAAVGGVTDVVHEYGCRWRAADGTAASGWVFAPPVTPGRAAALRRAAAQADGCRSVAGAPAYGSPSVAVRCAHGTGSTTTSFHGLFGDAWLSCSAPTEDLAAAGRWCVSVAQAATA
jgi:hypothetical protein